jgi:hypothetical protein
MKYVLRKGAKSRYIEAPFNIVGGRYELRELAQQILAQTESENFCYGTLYIVNLELQGSPNTKPTEWEE